MSVQLKEPCIRSLSRYYSFKAASRVQGNHLFLYRPAPTLFRLNNVALKQLYTTVALRTNENKLANQNTPTTQLQAWNEYLNMFNTSHPTLDAKKYEQILIRLSEGTDSYEDMDKWTRMARVYEDAKELHIQPTQTMHLLAVTAYGHLNQLEKTMDTFKEYKSNNRSRKGAFLRYIKALLQCKGAETEAQRVWRDCKVSRWSHPGKKEVSVCLAELVDHCSKRGHLWIAIKSAGEFRQSCKSTEWDKEALERVTQSLWNGYAQLLSIPNDAWNSPVLVEEFVDKYIEKSRLEQKKKIWIPDHLMTLFDLMTFSHPTTFSPTVKTCNHLLELYASKHNFSGLKSVLNIMQQLQVQPSSHTISLLIRVFGSSLNEQETYSFYNALKGSGKLDLDLYKVFIKVFTDMMDTKQAKRVMNDVRRDGHELDAYFASAMVQNFVKQDKTEEAVDWLKKHKYNGDNLDPYALIMESLLSQGRWNDCIAQYNSLKREGADQNRRMVKTLVTATSARGDWIHCEHILNELKIQFTPTTVSRIIDTLINLKRSNMEALVPGKKIIKAVQTIEKTLHIQLTADSIGKIITSLGHRGDYEDAYALYRWVRGDNGEDLSWVYTVSKRCSSRPIYNAMMKAAVECNDMRKLERAWVDMQYRDRFNTNGIPAHSCTKKQLIPVSAYNILLNGYASRLPVPHISEIKKTFRDMVTLGISPDTVSYNILIKAFIGSNDLDSAKKIFEEMVRSGNPPDSISLNSLLNGWIQRKDWVNVEKFVQELKSSDTLNKNVDIVTFNLLVQGFLRLDTKYNSLKSLQRRLKNWETYRQIREKEAKQCNPLPSETVWSIFETTIGYSKQTVENKRHIPKDTETQYGNLDNDAFLTIFEKYTAKQEQKTRIIPDEKTIEKPFIHLFKSGKRTLEADDTTYALFIRAFINNRDYKSASTVYHWMCQRSV
ncbi:hypothetical protein K501DRAFT_238266 [Backusella circina FSU 941]|nr:hypothetical protein K501DRAFT_238266 [Backusella circina FSU 941]